MFDNAGGKVKKMAEIYIYICIAGAVIALIYFAIIELFLAGLLYAVIICISGAIAAISMYALGDAAESAVEAAYYSKRIADLLKDQKETTKQSNVSTTGNAVKDIDKMPAWQKVEMERKAQEDAVRKAAEEANK